MCVHALPMPSSFDTHPSRARDLLDDIPTDLYVRVVALLRTYHNTADAGTVMRIRRNGAGDDEVTLMRVDQCVTTSRND